MNALFTDYSRTIFGWFLDYAVGFGKVELEEVDELPMKLAADEALVLPFRVEDAKAIGIANELREVFKLPYSRTSYYEIYRGPIGEPLRRLSCRNWSGERFYDFDFSAGRYPVIYGGGLHAPEDWGRWSSGTVTIAFELPDGNDDGKYRFAIKVRTCTGPKEADVFCDDAKVAHWRVERFEPEERIFEITGKKPGDLVTIRIDQSGLVRPCDVQPGSTDTRTIGLGFVSMRLIR